MQKIAINEIELAQRWGISPKTLQRWRTEGRGPRYFKLSKRVCYPFDQILAFENARSTSRPRNGALPAILAMRNWCRRERLLRPSTYRCTCSRIPRSVNLWECPSSMLASWCVSTSTR